MNDFRQITPSFWVSPQIGAGDVAQAASLGFGLVINNRPEGESPDQTPGETIARAAQAAGLDYHAIPVTHEGFTPQQVEAMNALLAEAKGKVLAYCRSGTRSTFLWALAAAARGTDPDEIAATAASAGYDVSGIRPMLDGLYARSAD